MDTSFLQEVEQFSNLKSSLDVKKRNAFEKANNKLNFAFNGGLFKADPKTILFAKLHDKSRELILIDTNDTPIHIEDISNFVSKAESLYYEAMNEYHLLFNDLKKQRTVKKVMDND
tara:strand:- start:12113 stop:12460 length:348 start_codon:yes stop_codon:yes gene_type:complete